MKKDFEPELADLNEVLRKHRVKASVKLTSLDHVDVPAAAVVWEVSISGLG